MALFQKRKEEFLKEGLFDPLKKKPIPFLPEVIGVITSESGAVFHDILHRLRERMPRKVQQETVIQLKRHGWLRITQSG